MLFDEKKLYDPFIEFNLGPFVDTEGAAFNTAVKKVYRRLALKHHPDKHPKLSVEESAFYPEPYFCHSPPDSDCIREIEYGSRIVFEKDKNGKWIMHACIEQPSYVKKTLTSDQGSFLDSLKLSEVAQNAQHVLNLNLEQKKQLDAILEAYGVCTRGVLHDRLRDRHAMLFIRADKIYKLLQDPLNVALYRQIEISYRSALLDQPTTLHRAKNLLLEHKEKLMEVFMQLHLGMNEQRCNSSLRAVVDFLFDFTCHFLSVPQKSEMALSAPLLASFLSVCAASVCAVCFTQNELLDSPSFMRSFKVSILLWAVQRHASLLADFVYLQLRRNEGLPSSSTQLEPWQWEVMQRCMIFPHIYAGHSGFIFDMLLVHVIQQCPPHAFKRWLKRIDCVSDFYPLAVQLLCDTKYVSPRRRSLYVSPRRRSLNEQYYDYLAIVKKLGLRKPDDLTSNEAAYQVTFNDADFDRVFRRNSEDIVRTTESMAPASGELDYRSPIVLMEFLLNEFVNLLKMRLAVYESAHRYRSQVDAAIADRIYSHAVKIENRLTAVSHLLTTFILKQYLIPELSRNEDEIGQAAEKFLVKSNFNIRMQVHERLLPTYQAIKMKLSLGANRPSYESLCILLLVCDHSRSAIDFFKSKLGKQAVKPFELSSSISGKVLHPNLSYTGWLSMRVFLEMADVAALHEFCVAIQSTVPNIPDKLIHYLRDATQSVSMQPITILQKPRLILDPAQWKTFLEMKKKIHSNLILFPRNSTLSVLFSHLENIISHYQPSSDERIIRTLANQRDKIKQAKKTVDDVTSEVCKAPYAKWILIIRHLETSERDKLIDFFRDNIDTSIKSTGSLSLLIESLENYPSIVIDTPLIPINTPPPNEVVRLEKLSPAHCQSLEAYLMLLRSLKVAQDVDSLKDCWERLEKEYRYQRYQCMHQQYEAWVRHIAASFRTLLSIVDDLKQKRMQLQDSISELEEKIKHYAQEDIHKKDMGMLDTFLKECNAADSALTTMQCDLKNELNKKHALLQAKIIAFNRDIPTTPSLIVGGTPRNAHSANACRSQAKSALKEMAHAAKLAVPEGEAAGFPTDETIQDLTAAGSQLKQELVMVTKKAGKLKNQLSVVSNRANAARMVRQQQYDSYGAARADFESAISSLTSLMDVYDTLCDRMDYKSQHTTMDCLTTLIDCIATYDVPVLLGEIGRGGVEYTTLIADKKQALDFLCETTQRLASGLKEVSCEDVVHRHQTMSSTFHARNDKFRHWFRKLTADYMSRYRALLESAGTFLHDFSQHDFSTLEHAEMIALVDSFEVRHHDLEAEFHALADLTAWYQRHGIVVSCDSNTLRDIQTRIMYNQDALSSVKLLLQEEEETIVASSAKKKRKKKKRSTLDAEQMPKAVEELFTLAEEKEAVVEQAAQQDTGIKKKKKKKQRSTTKVGAMPLTDDTSHTIGVEPEGTTEENTAAEEGQVVCMSPMDVPGIQTLHDQLSDIVLILERAMVGESQATASPALPTLQDAFPTIAEAAVKIRDLNETITKLNRQLMALRLKTEKIKSVMSADLYKVSPEQGRAILHQCLTKQLIITNQNIRTYETVIKTVKEDLSTQVSTLATTALRDIRASYSHLVIGKELLETAMHLIESASYNDLLWCCHEEDDRLVLQLSVPGGSPVVFSIESASTLPRSIIASLYLAVRSQQRLNSSILYLDHAEYVLNQTTDCLQNHNDVTASWGMARKNTEEIALYQTELLRISTMTRKAKQQITELERMFFSYDSLGTPVEREQCLKALITVFNTLSNHLSMLEHRFQHMPLLALHLQRMNIKPAIEALSFIVDKMMYAASTAPFFHGATQSSLPYGLYCNAPPIHLGIFQAPGVFNGPVSGGDQYRLFRPAILPPDQEGEIHGCDSGGLLNSTGYVNAESRHC